MFKLANRFSHHLYSIHSYNFSVKNYGKMKFIVFSGAPGVGKGTFAEMLAQEYNLKQLSMGEEFRKIIKGLAPTSFSPDLVTELRTVVNTGKYVDDEIVVELFRQKLKEPGCENGLVIDGVPRTIPQLRIYEKEFPLHLVVNLNLKFEILLEKLMGRRTCQTCRKTFNICEINRDGYEMEPLLPQKGSCDKCIDNPKLTVRDDDQEKVITERMKVYDEKSMPLIKEFEKKGILLNFEVKRGVKDYPQLRDIIKKRLNL